MKLQVLLVTGGWYDDNLLSSTEVILWETNFCIGKNLAGVCVEVVGRNICFCLFNTSDIHQYF